MSRKIPLLSPDLRRLYALFLGAVLLLFVIATALTGFTPALFFTYTLLYERPDLYGEM